MGAYRCCEPVATAGPDIDLIQRWQVHWTAWTVLAESVFQVLGQALAPHDLPRFILVIRGILAAIHLVFLLFTMTAEILRPVKLLFTLHNSIRNLKIEASSTYFSSDGNAR